MNGKLILCRHQESLWNEKGLWTGRRDIHLTQKGFDRSDKIGLFLKDKNIIPDFAFTSMEVRTIETLAEILNTMELYNIKTEHSDELDERDYGELTGKNKWEIEKQVGEEEFQKIRRSYEYIPKNGESLKMVYDRVIPYFTKHILNLINQGKNVLIVAHGNSLRALLKYIEDINDEDISKTEFDFNEIMIFDLNNEGKKIYKTIEYIVL